MPRVKTVMKHVTELTSDEYRRLHRLNMGFMGRMQGQFENCVNRENGWTVMHLDSSGEIDGWVLLFHDIWGEFLGTNPEEYVAYFYVSPEARRQGIGRALMRHAHTLSPEPFVCPWDQTSAAFFQTDKTTKVDETSLWGLTAKGLIP